MKINSEEMISIVDEGVDARDVLKEIALSGNQEDAFFVMDVGEIIKQYETWTKMLPRVKPFYAVKCNDSQVVLQIMAALGANFDCASKGEIDKVLDLGVTTDRIIYANPAKMRSHISYAAKAGVDLLTFDSVSELQKIKEFHPNAKLVLRISADSYDSQCPAMSLKFGADPGTEAYPLLKEAVAMGLNVVGISFHVGSGCREVEAFGRALALTASLFIQAQEGLGLHMTIVDIGGGFQMNNFEKTCATINRALSDYFGDNLNLEIIAEPGRFMVASAYTLATQIHSVRINSNQTMFYINDGVYGSFNCVLFDHATVTPIPLKENFFGSSLTTCSVWGPTCDSLDLVSEACLLPSCLKIGDWILFESMGAYTIPTSTNFNGFAPPKIHHICDYNNWCRIKEHLPETVDNFTYQQNPYWKYQSKT
uniref:ornithine decarboxylase n=1 Tax=Triatoma infestans TaxID=30076 RepID=A0A161M579_TRIIF